MMLVEHWFRRLPLGSKLNAIIMTIGGASMVLASVVFVTYDSVTSGNRLARDLRAHADFIAHQGTAAVALGDANTATEVVRSVTMDEDVASARIVLPNGRIFARYDRATPASAAPRII